MSARYSKYEIERVFFEIVKYLHKREILTLNELYKEIGGDKNLINEALIVGGNEGYIIKEGSSYKLKEQKKSNEEIESRYEDYLKFTKNKKHTSFFNKFNSGKNTKMERRIIGYMASYDVIVKHKYPKNVDELITNVKTFYNIKNTIENQKGKIIYPLLNKLINLKQLTKNDNGFSCPAIEKSFKDYIIQKNKLDWNSHIITIVEQKDSKETNKDFLNNLIDMKR